jgi:2-polyprenyl-6-methoxyphenol hydroxylase-like FAD-dependent oxidoreductase
MEGSHVVVIGGGPGGVLSAAHFASLGARVTVYERSTAEERESQNLGWTIALGRVAREAIEHADIPADFGPAARCGACTLIQRSPASVFHSTLGSL